MKQHIYLLRHGIVSGNAALYGDTDVPVLAEVNDAICTALKDTQITFDNIYSSPLQRCQKLADLISRDESRPQLNNVFIVNDLKEMNFGVFDGIPFDDIYKDTTKWQLLEHFWQSPSKNTLPQAESLTKFYQRIATQWRRIFEAIKQQKHSNSLDTETHTLIVCHGGVIRMILACLLKDNINESGWYQSYKVPYGSLTHLTISNVNVEVNKLARPIKEFISVPVKEQVLNGDEDE
ncbi:histidine phosphatase family protein [Thalassotalea profundi]|uniref:Alpha-ribazole phosphatase n=1 Tax=Thalassotalea profundi TaxID=2036687 RepID=A0ABQ3IWN9_9GAMM|nr:histidine phosphatase family protein [Thalassotalea profundi]GHE91637.1 alpha-ribazole phosphatase [Thalassotalea profundi]